MCAQTENYLQTGQVECHDSLGRRMDCAGSGQDGEFLSGRDWQPGSRFRLRDGFVHDAATGLCWLRDAYARPVGSTDTVGL
jgi:hypothetical protein